MVEGLIAAARREHVAWTILAALARIESNFGRNGGLIVGQRLSTSQLSQYGGPLGTEHVVQSERPFVTIASFLRVQGASGNAYAPDASSAALVSYLGSQEQSDRVGALAAFYGAIGTGGLEHGLTSSTSYLRQRVLADPRVTVYAGGRSDIKNGLVDTRVLMVIEYLANATGSVKVSSLVSGNKLFTQSGSVSAQVYGRAVDITAVGGEAILGHQGPGTVTEHAIKLLLMLPIDVRPRQIVSLMDLDGPTGNTGSFALPNHFNRIHIGY